MASIAFTVFMFAFAFIIFFFAKATKEWRFWLIGILVVVTWLGAIGGQIR